MRSAVSFSKASAPYEQTHVIGVAFIGMAGLSSLLAIVYLLLFRRPERKAFANTNMFGYFISLLVANILQSFGTVMNFEWLAKGGVYTGSYCSAQGGIKQMGNVATAVWSFIIAVHVFNVLFLRMTSRRSVFIGSMVAAWLFVLIIVLAGRFGIERPNQPYFGIAGTWCWITSHYLQERIFLEYFFSFISIVASFVLYSASLLRVRGNLVKSNEGRWRLQIVPKGEEWMLYLGRDVIDSSMLNVVKKMMWFPVAYTVIILPITICRLAEFTGSTVPYGLTSSAAVIFNLMGLTNVFLFIYLQRIFPQSDILPVLNSKRELFRESVMKRGGVSPFTVQYSETQESYRQLQRNGQTLGAQNINARMDLHSNYGTGPIHLTLPTRPSNAYVPPKEWNTRTSFDKF